MVKFQRVSRGGRSSKANIRHTGEWNEPGWRNGRRVRLKIWFPLWECGFKSRPRHQNFLLNKVKLEILSVRRWRAPRQTWSCHPIVKPPPRWICYGILPVPVAQLDRALVFGTKGWGFKSSRVHQGLWAHSSMVEQLALN